MYILVLSISKIFIYFVMFFGHYNDDDVAVMVVVVLLTVISLRSLYLTSAAGRGAILFLSHALCIVARCGGRRLKRKNMEKSVLSQLRARYVDSYETSCSAFSKDGSGAVKVNWPHAADLIFSKASSGNDCERCRRLSAEQHLLQQELEDNRRTIDLLTVTLEWERTHGYRHRGSFRHSDLTSDSQNGNTTPSANMCCSSDTPVSEFPSQVLAAYTSLKEARKKADDEWLQWRCRYDLKVEELKKKLARAERRLNSGIEPLRSFSP